MALIKKDLEQIMEGVTQIIRAEISVLEKRMNKLVTEDEFETRMNSLVTRDEFEIRINSLVTHDEFEIRMSSLVTQDAFETRIKSLPTRDEFFEWMSKLMGELQIIRDEHIVLAGKVEAIEEIHPNGSHTFKQ